MRDHCPKLLTTEYIGNISVQNNSVFGHVSRFSFIKAIEHNRRSSLEKPYQKDSLSDRLNETRKFLPFSKHTPRQNPGQRSRSSNIEGVPYLLLSKHKPTENASPVGFCLRNVVPKKETKVFFLPQKWGAVPKETSCENDFFCCFFLFLLEGFV